MTHHYTHYKRYEEIVNNLSKSNLAILQKALLKWNDKEIEINETEFTKLPQVTKDEINLLIEKLGYTSD
tara:strand:+ start:156 stop:362 length:207 start_codon:yes stop_codon:yes gene_type:complete